MSSSPSSNPLPPPPSAPPPQSARQRMRMLNGIRGAAALAVVYTHCMNSVQPLEATAITPWNPHNDAWHHVGEQGVLCFYVLSAFLLSWRFLQDWHKLKGFRARWNLLHFQENKKRLSYKWEGLEILKYFIRRFFRIYPLYFMVVLVISTNQISNAAFEWEGKNMLWMHLVMGGRVTHSLWAIPTECSFYLLLPPLVILYYWMSRISTPKNLLGSFLKFLLYASYILIIISLCSISVFVRANQAWANWGNDAGFFIPEYLIIFLGGMSAGIIYWELDEADLLLRMGQGRLGFSKVFGNPFTGAPLSDRGTSLPTTTNMSKKAGGGKEVKLEAGEFDEGKALLDDPHSPPITATIIQGEQEVAGKRKRVDLGPQSSFAMRLFLDGACYFLYLFLILEDTKALPHYTRLLYPGLPRLPLVQTEDLTGFLFGAIILFALLSGKSFNRLFQWNFLQYGGKVSYSLYIWHPIFVEIVFNSLWGANAVGYWILTGDSFTNNFFDLFCYTLAASWICATVSYHLVEKPCLWIAAWLISKLPKLPPLP